MQNTNESCHVAPLIVRHSCENVLFVFSLVLTTTQWGNCSSFSSEHRFSFGRKAGERRTWVCFTSKGSQQGAPASCLGIFIIPSGLNLTYVSVGEGRISRRANLPWRGSERRERPPRHHPKHLRQLMSPWVVPPGGGLNPALPALWAPDKMTACGDEGVSWIHSLRLSPGISFFCFSQMLLSWEFRETKQSLLLKLKSFPWLIVPVALLLTILPPPPQPLLLLLPSLPHLLCCLCPSHSLALYDS